MLKMDLLRMEASLCQHIIYTNQVLCQTLGGNDVNLLTITNPSISATRRDIIKRPYVVLTARVHPGESNSSWIMKGKTTRRFDEGYNFLAVFHIL